MAIKINKIVCLLILLVIPIVATIGNVSAEEATRDTCMGGEWCTGWTDANPNSWIEVRSGGRIETEGQGQWIYINSFATISFEDYNSRIYHEIDGKGEWHNLEPNSLIRSTGALKGWIYVDQNSKLIITASWAKDEEKRQSTWIWLTGKASYQKVLLRVAQGDRMNPGEFLFSGDSITSMCGYVTLTYQSDGNLVITRNDNSKVIWTSGTDGNPGGSVAMQEDGNLVIYNRDSKAIWSSSTEGHPGSYLKLWGDGDMDIYYVEAGTGGVPYARQIWNSRSDQSDLSCITTY